jgi:hypothetical protein
MRAAYGDAWMAGERTMALSAGTKVGSYEVLAPLGAGGPAFAHGRIMNELRRVRRSQPRIR